MKFTLLWLKDYLETQVPADEIIATLTKIGLEVEHVDDKAKSLSAFVVAEIISAEKHPNADKLKLCKVNIGEGEPIQVVCGAPNARAGMKSVFAKPGTYIPGKDFTIDVGVIRGVESRGMMCSGAELQLSEDSDGILDLPSDAPVGVSYASYLKLDDMVIDVAITPNRPDCTGVQGIARDLAAADIGNFIEKPIKPITGTFDCPVQVVIDKTAENLCPAFALRLVRGVKNGASPQWMQERLKAIGLRPINALVDITNYMTFDRARPLHVFDAKKVKGALTVRAAKKGETLTALDGKTYTLDDTMCVIADEAGVESLAGIMGGADTGVDETTTDVLIEAALWNETNIAQTGRKLGINSDARYRFERGVDPNGLIPGMEAATQMVIELCGGEASQITFQGTIPEQERVISFPLAEVKRLSGADVSIAEVRVILQALGFMISGVRDDEEWRVLPPSWRPDIHGKADLVEEIVRIIGVDRIPSTALPRPNHINAPVLTQTQKRKKIAQRALAARGFTEAVTWSFVSENEAKAFGGGQDELRLANPISTELSVMRPSLLVGLLSAVQRNSDRKFEDLALFEVGQIFFGGEPEQQKIVASALRTNRNLPFGVGRHWSRADKKVDVQDIKADCFALLSSLGASLENAQVTREAPSYFHPGRSAVVRLGPIILAQFGELHPQVLSQFKFEGTAVACEIFLEAIPSAKPKATKAKPALQLSAFQPVTRDFAFLVDEKIEVAAILKAARGVDKLLITSTQIFDVYQGKGVSDGKKSIALEVTIQPREKTLSDNEIEDLSQKIIAAITKSTGASLRS